MSYKNVNKILKDRHRKVCEVAYQSELGHTIGKDIRRSDYRPTKA